MQRHKLLHLYRKKLSLLMQLNDNLHNDLPWKPQLPAKCIAIIALKNKTYPYCIYLKLYKKHSHSVQNFLFSNQSFHQNTVVILY